MAGLLDNLTPDEMRRLEFYNKRANPEMSAFSDPRDPTVKAASEPSFLSKLGNKLKDPNTMAQLAGAFDSMTLNPNAGIQARATQAGAAKALIGKANQTAQYLRSQGAADLAALVEQDPSSAQAAIKAFTEKKMGTSYKSDIVGGLQTDKETGQQYFVQSNPNTGVQERIDVAGAIGETPAEKARLAATSDAYARDVEAAQERGQELFSQFNVVDQSLGKYRRIEELLDSEGADTGIIRQYLPSFTTATSELNQIARSMGIDVINSATFGALSATELRLALSIPLDLSLPPAELIQSVRRKIAAQTKLRNELLKTSRKLLSGNMTNSQFAEEIYQEQQLAQKVDAYDYAATGLTKAEWDSMNLQERLEYITPPDQPLGGI